MKFVQTFLVILCFGTIVHAQNLQVTTQTFDLESIDRHKGWAMYSGFKNSNGNYVLKIGTPYCNKSTNGNITTYSGVSYMFEELEFDATLKYINRTEKLFGTTLKTLEYEPIFGQRFYPQVGGFLLKRPLTTDFIGKKVVMPIIEMTGYKVGAYGVFGAATANHPKFGPASCGEIMVLQQLQDQKSKDNKGERWFALDHAIFPGGGVILFSTDGVVKDQPDKGHYFVRLFDGELNELARTQISLDYKAILSILPVDKPNGMKDFIVIAQATDFKYSAGKEIKSPAYAELIYLDGTTLSIKNKQSFTLTYTNWYAENTEVDNKGNIYLFGTAKADAKGYVTGRGVLPINQFMANPNSINSPKDQPNFQIVCTDADGNIKYVNGVDSKIDAVKALVIGGTSKKAKPEVILNTYDFKKDVFFTDNYLIIAGQQFVSVSGGVDKGSLFIACFELSSGNLVKYYIKPETTYAGQNVIFNKDRSALYWATYDLEEHNKLDGEQGAMTSTTFKNMFGADLFLSKIDLNNKTASDFTAPGLGKWAVNFNSPLVVSDEQSDVILFQGRTINKKAKDSELVLINVKK